MRANEDELRGLMTDGLDGNAGAHQTLLRLLVPLLRGYYRGRANGSADDIEDLVQETLIAVHTRRGTYDRERPFTGWLFAIARYKMIDHFRRGRRLQPIDGLEDILVAEAFEEAASARIDLDVLLEMLPTKQARVIRATRIEGLSVAEAAAADGIGESDVKVSVHRGLKSLMARIQGGGQ
jgi:RNA polymerase sigma-70 factor (ECF subfamily)